MDITTTSMIVCSYIIGLMIGVTIMSKDRIKVTKRDTYTSTPNELGKI